MPQPTSKGVCSSPRLPRLQDRFPGSFELSPCVSARAIPIKMTITDCVLLKLDEPQLEPQETRVGIIKFSIHTGAPENYLQKDKWICRVMRFYVLILRVQTKKTTIEVSEGVSSIKTKG